MFDLTLGLGDVSVSLISDMKIAQRARLQQDPHVERPQTAQGMQQRHCGYIYKIAKTLLL